jgi:hypothetical protein
MEHDFMSRGYLLPDGCKDLYDVLKLKQQRGHYQLSKLPKVYAHLPKGYGTMIKPPKKAAPLPPVKGEIIIPVQTTVSQLGALLSQKPTLIIADLMEMGVFAGASQLLGFETICRVARRYGFIAKKAA